VACVSFTRYITRSVACVSFTRYITRVNGESKLNILRFTGSRAFTFSAVRAPSTAHTRGHTR
jgi:hypothetical protein